jgi:hypothetical protein
MRADAVACQPVERGVQRPPGPAWSAPAVIGARLGDDADRAERSPPCGPSAMKIWRVNGKVATEDLPLVPVTATVMTEFGRHAGNPATKALNRLPLT